MTKKEELIKYFIDDFNTNIDLSSLIENDGVYDDNPFVAIEFKKIDDGSIKTQQTGDILRTLTPRNKYIPVSFIGVDLPKEISSSGTLESWVGNIRIAFHVEIENKTNFINIFGKLNDYAENFMKFRIDVTTIYGAKRQIATNASRVIDEQGSIKLLNRRDYKPIVFNVQTNIINKDVLRGSKRTFKFDGEVISTLSKSFALDKLFTDDADSGNGLATFIPDVAVRNITINVVLDYSSTFIKKVFDEIKSDGTDDKHVQTYALINVYTFPDETIINVPMTVYLAKYEEILNEQGAVILSLTFKEG